MPFTDALKTVFVNVYFGILVCCCFCNLICRFAQRDLTNVISAVFFRKRKIPQNSRVSECDTVMSSFQLQLHTPAQ